jgi:tetratricopeptide (TPR) repeat protein
MRTELAEILISLGAAEEALQMLEDAFASQAVNAVTYSIIARLLANKGDLDGARSAIDNGLSIEPGNGVLLKFSATLAEGRPLELESIARKTMVEAVQEDEQDNLTLELARSGRLRRLRQRLGIDDTAVDELKEVLQSDPNFAYAQILAARYGIWHASGQALPPVAAAFEELLAAGDLKKLQALTEHMPKLESLILLARAILGDAVAAADIADRLRGPNAIDDPQAIQILRHRFQPVFQLIEGGLEPLDAVGKCANELRIAIYDTNEAVSAPELMVA